MTSTASQAQDQAPSADASPPSELPSPNSSAPAAPAPESPGFRSRGRARRRARFLRKARELAYRDLGGLVFNLHRFGQRNDELVLAKLTTVARIDGELRTIEAALSERRPITVLREAGITACARCAAIHSSEDKFCPNCGLPVSRHVDLPIATAPAPAAPTPVVNSTPSASIAPAATATPSADATQTAIPPPVTAAPAVAPATPATPQPAPAASRVPTPGRSPVPPNASDRGPARPPSAVPAGPVREDEPTEILRPPPAGS